MHSAEGARVPAGDLPPGYPDVTVLAGVSVRGHEVTGPRLRALLALLAGEPTTVSPPPGWWTGCGPTSSPSTRPRRCRC